MAQFDVAVWKKRVAAWWREAAPDLPGTMARLGARTTYGLLLASAWLPLLTAYGQNPGPAVAALAGILSGVGNDLLSNLVQGAYDKATAPRKAEQEVAAQPELHPEYQQMLSGLNVLAAAQEALGKHWTEFEQQLSQELAQMGGGLRIDTGGAAVVFGDVDTGGGKFVGGDDTTIYAQTVVIAAERFLERMPHLSTQLDLRQATRDYLQYLLDRHRYLNLKGMGVSDRVPLRLPLLELYVPLRARQELPEGETWKRDTRLAGRELAEKQQQALAGRLSEPRPVLELLQQNDGLIILGDPGAGKTTFLKFLALTLALGEGEELGLGHRLPVLVPLSAFASALGQGNVRLDEFIATYYHELGADLFLTGMLADALRQGAALLLLDGLDEVKDPGLRHTVVERVVDFYGFQHKAGNKFVITSRIVGYREVRPAAEGLAECTLLDFDDEELEAFVRQWTTALERQAQDATSVALADAGRERRELLEAIHANPGVRRLAANPLLLTILALMKRQGVTLPERRVELYDQYVRTLLSTWNRARGLGRPPTRDLDVVQTVRILAPLALWMHEVSPALGLVKREELRRRLEAIYQERGEEHPEPAANQLLVDAHEHACLLLERGPGEYGFIHLTFEEFLAGVGIALQGQCDVGPIVAGLSKHVGDPGWREVARLTVSYLGIIQQRDQAAGAVVEALLERAPGDPGQAAVLAGEAVLDAWPGGLPQRSKDRTVQALIPAMQGAEVKAPLRRQAGLLLGRLGWLPHDVDAFVEVPAGKFLYGDEKRTREIPYRYWIASYPVTNAQYARFMKDGGYRRRELWSKEGWKWRERRQQEQPEFWEDSDFGNSLFPVVGVRWYEAEAYARWQDSALRSLPVGDKPTRPRPRSYSVRLPTELEWERAARGTDGREYPWAGEFDPAYANTEESDTERLIGIRTTAVCTYPQGISPVGAWDMSGNVWEWTLSRWSKKDPSRVLRGGSWFSFQRDARCAYGYWDVPDGWFIDVGFRVVFSLANPEF